MNSVGTVVKSSSEGDLVSFAGTCVWMHGSCPTDELSLAASGFICLCGLFASVHTHRRHTSVAAPSSFGVDVDGDGLPPFFRFAQACLKRSSASTSSRGSISIPRAVASATGGGDRVGVGILAGGAGVAGAMVWSGGGAESCGGVAVGACGGAVDSWTGTYIPAGTSIVPDASWW